MVAKNNNKGKSPANRIADEVWNQPKPPKEGPVIPQGARNNSLTQIAGYLRRAGLTEPELKVALKKVNRDRCKPPLPDGEVRSIAESISQYEPGETEDGPEVEFPTITAKDLAKGVYELNPLIQDVLYDRQPFIICGGSKTLKTTIAVDLSIALSTQGQFLRHFDVVQKCNVGLMSGESGLAVLQETALRIAKAQGKKLKNVDGLIFSDRLPKLGNPRHHAALEKWIDGNKLDVLIIDPVYLAIDADGRESSIFSVGSALRPIAELCQESGVTLGLVHHTRQTIRDKKPPSFNEMSWAGFEQWARQWLCLKRRKRFQDGTGEHALWMTVGGSAGHSGLYELDVAEGSDRRNRHWDVEVREGKTPEESRRDAVRDKRQQRIIDVLKKYPKGEVQRTIRQDAKLSSKSFQTAIQELISDGTVKKSKTKRGRNKCIIYSLSSL